MEPKEDSSSDESMESNKFVVMLKKIHLNIEKPVDCIIQYECSLFSAKITGKPFRIGPNGEEGHEIKGSIGYNEYTIMSKESEIKTDLEDTPLQIKVFDQNNLLGTAIGDLSQLLGNDAERFPYGLRYKKEVHIFGKDDDIIGTLDCCFVLEKEECICCKSCNEFFKQSAILRHVKCNKECGETYSDEDIKALEEKAAERKKKMRNIRDKRKYDPVKRAERHHKYYDPVKRAQNHEKMKNKQKSQSSQMQRNALIQKKKSKKNEAHRA